MSFNFITAVTVHSDLEPKKRKPVAASNFRPSICHEVMGLDAMILVFCNVEIQDNFFTLLIHSHQEAV